MDSLIAEIKAKNDIVDVLSQYMTLKKAGRQYIGLCPFHKEKSPSFAVSAERQVWYCFGACHEGGDVISFVMKIENIGFYEALQELANRAGIPLTDVKFQDREWNKKEVLFKINSVAADYYKYVLRKTEVGAKAMEYLHSRGLNDRILDTFELGYAPNAWDSLLKFLLKKKFSTEDIYRSGLIVKSERGSGFYDRFRGRVIFPIRDIRNNIIGFSGRIIGDSKEAKYINVPETELYRKRESLYGIHITKDVIREHKAAILVEGEFDVIGPYQQGFGNIVAIKGSSVTRDHFRILKRYAPKIILSLDADAAGRDAVERAIKESEEMDLEIYVMRLKGGKDPDEVVRANPAAFKEAIRQAVPAYDFLLDAIHEKHPGESPFEKKKAVDEIVQFLYLIKNPVVRSYYIKHSSDRFGVDEESLKEVLAQYNRKSKRPFRDLQKQVTEKSPEEPALVKQKLILNYIFRTGNPVATSKEVFEYFAPKDFTYPALRRIAEALESFPASPEGFEVNSFAARIPPELHPVFDELYLDISQTTPPTAREIIKTAMNCKLDILNSRKRELIEKNDSGEFDDQLRTLTQEIAFIKKSLRG
ncbi:MAG: DNA primase [Patescibacteria group bacterium]|nr:DNA primase [Patescibacteria group bacterium]